MKLLHNEKECFCTLTELLNFMFTVWLVKLDMIGAAGGFFY